MGVQLTALPLCTCFSMDGALFWCDVYTPLYVLYTVWCKLYSMSVSIFVYSLCLKHICCRPGLSTHCTSSVYRAKSHPRPSDWNNQPHPLLITKREDTVEINKYTFRLSQGIVIDLLYSIDYMLEVIFLAT